MGNYNRITYKERMRIEAGIYAGKSFGSIAKQLGRSTSSIAREVKTNREIVGGSRPYGKDCARISSCPNRHVCGDEDCPLKCWTCFKYDCTKLCESYKKYQCEKLLKPPYVCANCRQNSKQSCRYEKSYYFADKAHAKATKERSHARQGVRLTPRELRELDELISPLIRQGQPLSHIYCVHKNSIPVSERTIYNYIENGDLSVRNLDLRRRVRYRRRRKRPDRTKCDKYQYRQGRTYEDFRRYMEEHPDAAVVEMDTVRGRREKEQVILTFMFLKNSVMLMFLISEETQKEVIKVFDMLTKSLGIRRFRKLFPVILTDNGRSFKDAIALEYTSSGAPRTRVFYCDPQASWQKPHLEKNHEFIRYVIPRGKTLQGYTQEEMTLIANHINSTVRPSLGYKSPYELVDTEEMKKLLETLQMATVPHDEVCLKPTLVNKN